MTQDTNAINLAGETSLTESLWLMAAANACVCNDSSALHMASSLQIPTLAIYCSTVPEFGFGPWRNTARIAQLSGLPCSLAEGMEARYVLPALSFV